MTFNDMQFKAVFCGSTDLQQGFEVLKFEGRSHREDFLEKILIQTMLARMVLLSRIS